MFEWFLIGGGILLIIIAIVVALLPVASYIPIPILGDILDIAISPIIILLGVIMIIIGAILGGLGYFISQFWWLVPLVLIVWFIIVLIMKFTKKKTRGR